MINCGWIFKVENSKKCGKCLDNFEYKVIAGKSKQYEISTWYTCNRLPLTPLFLYIVRNKKYRMKSGDPIKSL